MSLAILGPPNAKVRRPSGKRITTRDNEKALRPYALAIGRLNLEWAKLQEWLGLIFSATLRERAALALAVWHSLKNNRKE
jgi:hypothetical protein